MARRTKATEPRIAAILELLRQGNTRRAAAGASGISEDSLRRWMIADAAFCGAVEKAESEAEAFYLSAVLRAAHDPKTWTAAAWWLERRKNQDYARHDKVDMQIDLRKEVERIAAEEGLDPAVVMAEAEAIMRGGR